MAFEPKIPSAFGSEYRCDDCGRIADPAVMAVDGVICEDCEAAADPLVWLKSFSPGNMREREAIRKCIAGLAERDEWMPVIQELHQLLFPGDNPEVDDCRDLVEAVRNLITPST